MSEHDGARRRVGLAIVLLAALVARIVAAATYPPSDDLKGWRWVAEVLNRGGDPYLETTRLNWPPLWMWWIQAAAALSRLTELSFDACIRALPIAADLALVALLARRSLVAAAVYALHPVALTTTGSQAQFDALPALAVYAAVELLSRRRTATAGVVLGVGAALKTWPLFVLPALVACTRGWRGRAWLGLTTVAVPGLLLGWLLATSPDGVRANVLSYRSEPGWWGLTSVGILWPTGTTRAAASLWARHGSVLMLLGVLVVAVLAARRDLAHRQGALAALLVFLALTPGFGPQYLLWVVALGLDGRALPMLWHVLASLTVIAEFYLLPRITLSSAFSVAESSILGNQMSNWVRLPVYLAGVAWLLWLLSCERPARDDATGVCPQ